MCVCVVLSPQYNAFDGFTKKVVSTEVPFDLFHFFVVGLVCICERSGINLKFSVGVSSVVSSMSYRLVLHSVQLYQICL